jgi:hypothetical protein
MLALVGVWWIQSAARGSAEPASFGASLPSSPVSSVFHIAKSENRNQVHYAVRVDARCRPAGNAPMYGYWRDLEDGPKATSPLLDHEQPAYGLTAPRSIVLNDEGGEIRIGMRGFPDRALRVVTFKQGGECRARAFTPIRKEPAVLRSIYVELGFLFSVDYVIVRGVRVTDGREAKERVDD